MSIITSTRDSEHNRNGQHQGSASPVERPDGAGTKTGKREGVGVDLAELTIGGSLLLFAGLLLRLGNNQNSLPTVSAGVLLFFLGLLPMESAINAIRERGGWRRLATNLVASTAAIAVPLGIVDGVRGLAGGAVAGFLWTAVSSLRGLVKGSSGEKCKATVIAAAGVIVVILAGGLITAIVAAPEWALSLGKGGIAYALISLGVVLMIALATLSEFASKGRSVRRVLSNRMSRKGLGLARIVAAIAAVGGGFVLTQALDGMSGVLQALVGAAAFIGGASIVVKGERYMVAMAAALITVWVFFDRSVDRPVVTDTKAKTITVLGDSFASGEGADVFFSGTNIAGGNECRQSPTAFGPLLAEMRGANLDFRACSGARADHIDLKPQVQPDRKGADVGKTAQLDDGEPANPNDAKHSARPDTVLISVGGNDAGFGDIGIGCAVPGSCLDAGDEPWTSRLGAVRADVTRALVKTGKHFPESDVVVVPYPTMVAEKSCSATPFNDAEHAFLVGFIAELNGTIRQATEVANAELGKAANIRYFDGGERVFEGQELCAEGATEPVAHSLAFAPTEGVSVIDRLYPRNWIHNTFHPTPYGHELMAAALNEWLDAEPTDQVDDGAIESGSDTDGATDVDAVAESGDTQPEPADAIAEGDSTDTDAWVVRNALAALRLVLLPIGLLLAAGWLAGALLVRAFGQQLDSWCEKLLELYPLR